MRMHNPSPNVQISLFCSLSLSRSSPVAAVQQRPRHGDPGRGMFESSDKKGEMWFFIQVCIKFHHSISCFIDVQWKMTLGKETIVSGGNLLSTELWKEASSSLFVL